MGWGWSPLRVIEAVLTGGQSEVIRKEVQVGEKTVEVVIDLNEMIVTLGKKVFRAIPGEFFYPGIGPLAELLKNEVEDEFLLVCPLGVVPVSNFSVTQATDLALAVGSLLQLYRSRRLTDEESAIAEFVFGSSITDVDQVLLTNISGLGGRQFTIPSNNGGIVVNLGDSYRHDGSVDDWPLLLHELTHGWQIRRKLFAELFLCPAIVTQAKNKKTDQYAFTPGAQWREYGLEQQASIVEEWVAGGSEAKPYSLGSVLFPYVNRNVRRADEDADLDTSGSLRSRLDERSLGPALSGLGRRPDKP